MAVSQRHSFSAFDYCVFATSLLISMGIGLWFMFAKKGERKTANEFLTGGHSMPVLPTALSLFSSLISGIAMLSYPSEIYFMGTAFVWSAVGIALALASTAIFVIPVIHASVDSESVYQYLEQRFRSRLLRRYGALMFMLATLLYMAIVLYAPSLALATISSVPLRLLILTLGIVCTVYTSLGGIRAVVWTDAFQTCVMFAGVITLLVKGTTMAGGATAVYRLAAHHGRLDGLTNFEPDPFQHMTAFTALFGGYFYWFSSFASNQMALQRYCAIPTVGRAQLMAFLAIPFMVLIAVLVSLIGLVMFAYYIDCDPLKAGFIDKSDQLVIYFMVEVFDSIPGLPGLFLACLFSGTLSTVSSGINSLSAVAWAELIAPLQQRRCAVSEQTATLETKIAGCVFGGLAIALAFSAEELGGILRALTSGLGVLGAPLLGLMLLGTMTSFANFKGALAGVVVATSVTVWIFVGSILHKPLQSPLVTFATNCSQEVVERLNVSVTASLLKNATFEPTTLTKVYSLSIFVYSLLGTVLCVSVGATVSLLTGGSDVADSRPQLVYWTLRRTVRAVPVRAVTCSDNNADNELTSANQLTTSDNPYNQR